MTESAKSILLRFAPAIYGPTLFFSIGMGAIVPLLPVMASDRGADLALSGFIASIALIGQLCGNLPAGWLVSKVGERITMVAAAAVALVGVLGIALLQQLALFAVSVFLIGMSAAAFGLARHAFMTMHVPYNFRARALSLLGGTNRLGMFLGPFISAALLSWSGTATASAWFFAVSLAVCVAVIAVSRDPESALAKQPPAQVAEAVRDLETAGDTGPIRTLGVFGTMRKYRGVLARLGLSASALAAVRQARQVALPLWGVSLGLESHTIALVVGISGALDFALFYASGQVMDRFGRLMAVLPSLLLMGSGFLVLSFTHDIGGAAVWYMVVSGVVGIGNGLSSGILMTLGADLAPPDNPAPFLGSWRLLNDSGGALAPVLFSGVAAVAPIGIATGVIGVIALLGAAGFTRWIPRAGAR